MKLSFTIPTGSFYDNIPFLEAIETEAACEIRDRYKMAHVNCNQYCFLVKSITQHRKSSSENRASDSIVGENNVDVQYKIIIPANTICKDPPSHSPITGLCCRGHLSECAVYRNAVAELLEIVYPPSRQYFADQLSIAQRFKLNTNDMRTSKGAPEKLGAVGEDVQASSLRLYQGGVEVSRKFIKNGDGRATGETIEIKLLGGFIFFDNRDGNVVTLKDVVYSRDIIYSPADVNTESAAELERPNNNNSKPKKSARKYIELATNTKDPIETEQLNAKSIEAAEVKLETRRGIIQRIFGRGIALAAWITPRLILALSHNPQRSARKFSNTVLYLIFGKV